MGKVDLVGKLHDARARVEAEAHVEERGLAKFARLTRKDARLRPDQDAALIALAKELMRRRRVKGERLTENTLIRIAIDLLLAHADTLRGSTEDELRNSVTSAVQEHATPALPHPATSGLPNVAASALADSVISPVPQAGASGVAHSRSTALAESAATHLPVSRATTVRDAAEPETVPPAPLGFGVSG